MVRLVGVQAQHCIPVSWLCTRHGCEDISSPVRDELEPGEDEARDALRRQLRQRGRQRLEVAELGGADRLRRLQLADEADEGPEVGPRREVAQPLVEVPLQDCSCKDATPLQHPTRSIVAVQGQQMHISQPLWEGRQVTGEHRAAVARLHRRCIHTIQSIAHGCRAMRTQAANTLHLCTGWSAPWPAAAARRRAR